MDNNKTTFNWQDGALFGLRWVYLIIIALVLYLASSSSEQAIDTGGIVLAFAVGAVSNILFFAVAWFPRLRIAVPVTIILGDWLMAGLLMNASGPDMIRFVLIAGTLIVVSGFRLGPIWGVVQSVGTILISFGVLVLAVGGFDQVSTILSTEGLPLMVVVALAVVSGVWSIATEQELNQRQAAMNRLESKTNNELKGMRDRTRLVYDTTAMMSSTLNFDKVLDAVLEAGRVGIRETRGRRLVGTVLLFRGEGGLQVNTGRGLTRNDMNLVIPGQQGIIGKALRDAVPVFGQDPKKDPELQYFVGFQGSKSILCIPLRANFDNFGVVIYGSEMPDAFTTDDLDLLTALGTQATIALQNAMLYANLEKEKERIVDVEEDARKKLARDLHDGPTQSVSAIAMRMSYIYRLLERQPDEVPAELKKVEELARNTTKEIRHMLFTLRPLVLENQGLEAALNQLAEKMMETHQQAVAINVRRDVEQVLDKHQQGVIFYIVEEAVGNARKHAEAELISVSIQRQTDVVMVEIADNGVGFDTGAVDANYDSRGSLGMVNMRERTELLDGSLRIESAEGRGTTITVLVPLRDDNLMNSSRTNNRKVAARH